MNNSNVEEIKAVLENFNKCDEIVASKSKIFMENNKLMNEFTPEYLDREYQKIVSAREKSYSTYRSEYRVIKTLITKRNELISRYHINFCYTISVDRFCNFF